MTEIFEPIPYLKGERVTKAELSDLFGEPLAELDRWVRAGCPCERTGSVRSPLAFDTAQTLAWRIITLVAENGGEHAARVARLEWERDALEARLAQRRA